MNYKLDSPWNKTIKIQSYNNSFTFSDRSIRKKLHFKILCESQNFSWSIPHKRTEKKVKEKKRRRRKGKRKRRNERRKKKV